MKLRRSSKAMLPFTFATVARAATFTVTTTADSGAGSLRQAILDANNSPGSTITFAIGSGVQTIRPLTVLPELFFGGSIDGTTQPGYAASPFPARHTSSST